MSENIDVSSLYNIHFQDIKRLSEDDNMASIFVGASNFTLSNESPSQETRLVRVAPTFIEADPVKAGKDLARQIILRKNSGTLQDFRTKYLGRMESGMKAILSVDLDKNQTVSRDEIYRECVRQSTPKDDFEKLVDFYESVKNNYSSFEDFYSNVEGSNSVTIPSGSDKLVAIREVVDHKIIQISKLAAEAESFEKTYWTIQLGLVLFCSSGNLKACLKVSKSFEAWLHP